MARVWWITGLSGAGKTTVGKLLYEKLKKDNPAIILLDGDVLREAFGADLGYSEDDRRKCAMRYSRMCKMLSEQGITIVMCTISMYDEVRAWNRENIKEYYEVYLKVSPDVLYKRNQKNLYSDARAGKRNDVVGSKGDFEEPKMPDIIIHNDGNESPESLAEKLYQLS